jgi:signal transduction histidine kinase
MFNNGLISAEELAIHLLKIDNLVSSTDLLFTNIMQWSHHYSGETIIFKEKLYLRKIIDSNIEMFKGTIHEKGNKIQLEVDARAIINGNETIMNLVFKNLISNANKFTEDGLIRFMLDSTKNVLVIQDNGVGMTSDQLSSLFNWEVKISTLGTRLEKGAGVGLLICKEFLEKIGANLQCDSKPGQGTTVTIRFPQENKNKNLKAYQYADTTIGSLT